MTISMHDSGPPVLFDLFVEALPIGEVVVAVASGPLRRLISIKSVCGWRQFHHVCGDDRELYWTDLRTLRA